MTGLDNTPELLTRRKAAEILGLKPQTLAVWATTGRYGLRYIKVGRSVRYALKDLLAFLNSGTITGSEAARPTAENGVAAPDRRTTQL